MDEPTCDHCGKAEYYNVLCPDCEDLCCDICGRVECCCIASEKEEITSVNQLKTVGRLCTEAVQRLIMLMLGPNCRFILILAKNNADGKAELSSDSTLKSTDTIRVLRAIADEMESGKVSHDKLFL